MLLLSKFFAFPFSLKDTDGYLLQTLYKDIDPLIMAWDIKLHKF